MSNPKITPPDISSQQIIFKIHYASREEYFYGIGELTITSMMQLEMTWTYNLYIQIRGMANYIRSLKI